jgi:hypothetical protein
VTSAEDPLADRPRGNTPAVDWRQLAARVDQRAAEIAAGIQRPAGLQPGEERAAAIREIFRGWLTWDEATEDLEFERACLGRQIEAEKQRRLRDCAELAAKLAEARADAAAGLRRWCNERTVPSRYRRDGVELAAQWLE